MDGGGWMDGEIDGNGAEEGGRRTDVWLCGTRFIVLYDKTFPLRYPAQVPQGGAISTLCLKHCLFFWLRYHFAVMFALRTVLKFSSNENEEKTVSGTTFRRLINDTIIRHINEASAEYVVM